MVIKIQGKRTRLTFMHAAVDIIRSEMESQGLSRAELARRAKIGRPYLYRVLEGSQTPTMDWLEKVFEALGVSIEISFQKSA